MKLCEELDFVKPGTTVVADDIIQSNNVEYSAYMRESPAQKKQHVEKEGTNKREEDLSLGNPNLVYETSLFHGREPTDGDVRRNYCCYFMITFAEIVFDRTVWKSLGAKVSWNRTILPDTIQNSSITLT